MTATTDQPNHQYNVMWLTWTNQQYYLLQRTLFSHFTNTLRQFLWNVLHFVFQFIHIFWHWKQKEIADLTFFENAPKRAFACVKKRDVYTPLEKRNKCILISVKWYDCCCIKKKSVKKKMTFFINQSSKFMFRNKNNVRKNYRNERSTNVIFWTC